MSIVVATIAMCVAFSCPLAAATQTEWSTNMSQQTNDVVDFEVDDEGDVILDDDMFASGENSTPAFGEESRPCKPGAPGAVVVEETDDGEEVFLMGGSNADSDIVDSAFSEELPTRLSSSSNGSSRREMSSVIPSGVNPVVIEAQATPAAMNSSRQPQLVKVKPPPCPPKLRSTVEWTDDVEAAAILSLSGCAGRRLQQLLPFLVMNATIASVVLAMWTQIASVKPAMADSATELEDACSSW